MIERQQAAERTAGRIGKKPRSGRGSQPGNDQRNRNQQQKPTRGIEVVDFATKQHDDDDDRHRKSKHAEHGTVAQGRQPTVQLATPGQLRGDDQTEQQT